MLAEPSLKTIVSKLEVLKVKGLGGYPGIEFSITGFEEDETKRTDIFTIEVSTELNIWVVKKTYQEFKELCDDLKKKYHVNDIPGLPRKSMFTSKAQVSLQRRKLLQEVLAFFKSSSTTKMDVVQEFLDFPTEQRVRLKEVWEVLELPIIEGELEKLGGNYKNWRRRHVQCCADYTLKYYDPARWLHGADNKLAMLKGVVDLKNIISMRQQSSDPLKKFILEITTKERVWKFACRSQKELDAWFTAVQLLREDKVGLKEWLPIAADDDKSRSRSLFFEDSEDEELKEDQLLIKQAQEKRGNTEREIQHIQEKIQEETVAQKRRNEMMVKAKLELDNQQQILSNINNKIDNIIQSKAKLNIETSKKTHELTNLALKFNEQYKIMLMENNEYKEVIDKNSWALLDKAVDEEDGVYHGFMDLDPSPIVEGRLWKFGKAGRKRAKRKYVVFVALDHGCYVEWTDSVKSNQATTRMKLLGWSIDNNLMDSKKLKDDEVDRIFILLGTNRMAVFLAESTSERDRWIDGFQRVKLMQLAGKR